MAKFGEGDKRWIVQDRSDGANVHNWHWAEKDCLEWTRKRLGELLENVKILNGEGGLYITTKNLESVTGEAYVNIRKGKIIPGYEIKVVLNWSGEAKDGSGNSLAQVEGKVELPYIADENADEEPELRVSVLDESPIGQRLREAFLAKGKPIVLERLERYVTDMAAGGPAKEELAGKQVSKGSEGKVLDKDVKGVGSKQSAPTKSKPQVKEGFKTISLVERFHCRPQDIYSTLLDEKRWKGFTQSNAQISKEAGGTFSVFDGAVTGVNQQLQENKLIVQKWRFSSWNDGQYSTVSLYNI
ncbi:hypothetical protein O6H91_04G008900 [Diphasiastrum complanatum]|uniref:Uncharacterized protein n=1 Tax=Diphasiastrum complanatum TaxID=34168 RepID=A0ACC2DU99_DIPCM|nr:hypothetical protein O6H91_04G008900 [Diphasiastrum complanatum]